MKRLLLIPIPLAMLIAGGLFIWWEPYAPRFQRIGPSFVPPKSEAVFYGVSAPPFVGGKVWVTAWASTNRAHYYLFDIGQKKVIGELTGATPVFSDPEHTTVLCMQRDAVRLTFADKLKALWERVSGRGNRNRLSLALDTETFWAVDLNRSSASRLGDRKTMAGGTSLFMPSPTARYANSPSVDPTATVTTFFCDLTQRRWWTQTGPSWPMGWWDDENMIRISPAGNFELVNIQTAATRTLLTRGRISSFLQQHGLADSRTSSPNLFSFWNGRQFEFYLTDGQHFLGETSHFIRLRRPDATLELVTKSFEFEPSGQFDETGTRYVYAPRNVGQCCNGVSVRDLNAKTDRVLVPATASATLSFPSFYHDSIIYGRSNTLWRIDFNGSNHVRLYPPPVKD